MKNKLPLSPKETLFGLFAAYSKDVKQYSSISQMITAMVKIYKKILLSETEHSSLDACRYWMAAASYRHQNPQTLVYRHINVYVASLSPSVMSGDS